MNTFKEALQCVLPVLLVSCMALVSSADVIKINFQVDETIDDVTYPELTGYVADFGEVYGFHGNGYTYGWSTDVQDASRNRNNATAPDERYDTLVHMGSSSWTIQLDNGLYDLWIGMGDSAYTYETDISLVSGANELSLSDPDGADNFDEYFVESFAVTNGTLRIDPDAVNPRILFIEIEPVDSASSNVKIGLNFVGGAGSSGTLNGSDAAGLVGNEIGNSLGSTMAANWNNLSGSSGSDVGGLVDSMNRDMDGVTVTWSANGTWSIPNTTGGNNTSDNTVMMKGYVYGQASATTVTIEGLDSMVGTYTVVVYCDGDNDNDWKRATYTIGSTSVICEDSEDVDFNCGSGNNANGLFQIPDGDGAGNQNWPNSPPNNREGNMMIFTGVSGSSFTLTALPESQDVGATPRAPLNAIQILGVMATASKSDQTIHDFTPTNGSTFVATDAVGLSATASSGLPVSFSVASGPGTISGGTNLSFSGAGTVFVAASQAGDETYNPAPTLTNLFSVGKGAAQVFIQDLAQMYDGIARSVTATTMPAGLTVEFTYDGFAWAPTNAGSYAVTGMVNDVNWEGSCAGVLVVSKAGQSIVFPAIPAQIVTATVGLAATGGESGNPVVFSVAGGPGCLDATNLTFTAVGDVKVVAEQMGNNNYNAATDVTNIVKVFNVTPASGPLAGGHPVTFSNGWFGVVTNVLIVGSGATGVIDGGSSNWFTVILPAAVNPGTVDFVVQSELGADITLMDAYTYNPAGEIGGTAYDWSAWDQVAGLPEARDQMYAAELNGSIYAVAGRNSYWSPQTNVYQFNGTSWTEVAGLPVIRTPAGAIYDGKIHVMGGAGGSGYTNVFAFDGSSWTEVAGLPRARVGGMAGTLDGTMYYAGGQTNNRQSSTCTNVYAYDGSSWTEVRGLPKTRNGAVAGTLSSGWYLAGGVDAAGGLDPARTNTYVFDGSGWSESEPLISPRGRAFSGSVVLSNMLYVLGGWDGAGSYSARTNVYRFDGTNWIEIAGLPVTIQSSAGVAFDGFIYSIGGYDSTARTHMTNVYRYPAQTPGYGVVPESGSWTGGYQVTISGINLGNGSDVTNVTLCGVVVDSIVSQSSTQIVVVAEAGTPGLGNVRVYSVSYGETVKTDAFRYIGTQAISSFVPTNGSVFSSSDLPGLSAEASSGLPVSFAVASGPGSISGDTNLSFSAHGAVQVVALQDGNASWLAAPAITNTYTVHGVPEVGPVTVARFTNQLLKAADLQLLTNAVDPEGSALTVTWVSAASTNGGSVYLDGRWVTYMPPGGDDSADYFSFRVSNAYGGIAESVAKVLTILPAVSTQQTRNIVSVQVVGQDTHVRFAGIVGRTFKVEAADSLTPPSWYDVGTCTIGAQGYTVFVDTNAPSLRYYRTVRPE